MKCKFLLLLSFLSAGTCFAQKAEKAYAITGKNGNSFFWSDIKEIDIATGTVTRVLFDADKSSFKSADNRPTEYGVAACALDSRHNRLYFAPLHFAEIRYLDLNKKEANFIAVQKNVLAVPLKNGFLSEENHITRMVIAADGYGYALTNDANHLIRFSTGKNTVVEDLGNLIDAPENKGLSIHNKCTSWGGDMLADAFGKLVVISANHNVFSVDVNTRIAKYTGTITGLPVNFTTNGAVVNGDGDIVVSSANVFDGLFKFNTKDFKSVSIPQSDKTFNASDLANGILLNQKEADAINKFDMSNSVLPALNVSEDAAVFPNPVSGNQFSVYFEKRKPGKYTLVFADLAGRPLSSKVVTINKGNQIETFTLQKRVGKGTYLLNVIGENKQLVFTERVIIQ
jgi:hypothetical protein